MDSIPVPSRPRHRQKTAVSCVAGFLIVSLLSPSIAFGQDGKRRALEKEYVENAWRFRNVRCFEDYGDLEALEKRLGAQVSPEDLSGAELADFLCLELLIRKGLAGVREFERRRTDPGMVLPTGDLLDRALMRRGGPGPDGRAEKIHDYISRLAARLDEAPQGWDLVERRYIESALNRASKIEKGLGEVFFLLLKNLPAAELHKWESLTRRILESLEGYRACLLAVRDSLPEETVKERNALRKKDLDFQLRWDYLVDFDSDELLRRGADFFLKTLGELEREAKRIEPGRSWMEILKDGEEDHPPRGKLVEWAEKASKEAIRFVEEKDLITMTPAEKAFDVVAGNPDGPTPFAHYLPRRGGRKAAYVVVPCGEKWSPGRVKDHLRANNLHWLKVVALHEAVPGHHLQFSIAARVKNPIRRFFRCPAYFEGWGLYCEEMMARHGYYGPKARLTQLRMKLWRAARVLSAVGMNHRGLSEAGSAELLRDRVLFKAMHAVREAKMHRKRPAYFTAYSVGFWQIEKLRRALEERWGESYSDKRFHDAFLSFGPIPVPIIEKVLLRERKPPGPQ
jgi:hypothetical protein